MFTNEKCQLKNMMYIYNDEYMEKMFQVYEFLHYYEINHRPWRRRERKEVLEGELATYVLYLFFRRNGNCRFEYYLLRQNLFIYNMSP
jgi:hypothetical protein